MVVGCRFKRAFENPNLLTIDLRSVGSFTLVGCQIGPYGPVMRIGRGVERAVILGNIFDPSPYDRVIDESSTDAEIIIRDNVGMEPRK